MDAKGKQTAAELLGNKKFNNASSTMRNVTGDGDGMGAIEVDLLTKCLTLKKTESYWLIHMPSKS
jgi:hypothetical protein